MTDRERLSELMCEYALETNGVLCDGCGGNAIEDVSKKLADHLVANGVTFHKWVPTALGFLPEEYGRYLCVVKSFAFPGSVYYAILQYDKYGFRDGHIYTDDVVYWMPLPESPEEA